METPSSSNPFKKLVGYFLQGLLYTVPLAVTIWVIVKIVFWVNDEVVKLIPITIPGLSVLMVILAITIIGFVGSNIIFSPIKSWLEKLLDRIPLVKTIYTAINDLLSAFVGKKKSFNQPVLVTLSASSPVQKLGFITQKNLKMLGVGEEMVAVYLPHSYAWSGNLYIVPAKHVTPLNASAADVMKFIVSGGVTDLEQESSDDL